MDVYERVRQNILAGEAEEVSKIVKLEKWKNSKRRKPLIIMGARQVGKTWLMKEFGKKYYKKV